MKFCVRDSRDEAIHIKDIVSYTETSLMGEARQVEGIVISLFPDNMLEVQPMDKGLPINIHGGNVTVEESLIREIHNLANYEEFQQLMLNTEARYKTEKAASKTTRKAKSAEGVGKSKAPKDGGIEIELEL